MSRSIGAERMQVGRRVIEIARPDKLLFPRDGITKGELVAYYRKIAPIMVPYLRGRPVSMERYPDGISAEGFFQKKIGPHFPEWLTTASMPKQKGTVRHVICNDAAALTYLASQAVVTPHTWLSRVDRPNYPDELIFDLDPSTTNFPAVCEAAKRLRDLLRTHRLASYVKTTGSRGLHVMVILDRRSDFGSVRAFAHQIAEELAHEDATHLTTEVRKDKRGDRIFLDTARNAYAQTAVAPYAVRPRDGAPVAAPLTWEELDNSRLKPDQFTVRNIFDRLHGVSDPWKGINRHAQKLPP
jgi:bifunctional non-homologous end joining protein LigD